jgi:type VI secretion system protein ImpC
MIDNETSLEADFTFGSARGHVVDDAPFRLLVLGDWSGDADLKPFSERKPVEIDRDNFDDLIAKLGTRLRIDHGDAGSSTLTFQSLDDFHPDQIFQQLPIFERLRALRKDLLSSDRFDRAAGEVRSWLNVETTSANNDAPPTQSTVSSEGLLDSILSGSTAPAPKVKSSDDSELASLIKDIVRPHLISVDENEQSALLAAVDAATSELMRSILHDHRFQALEAAWRGLYLVVRRVETDSDLRIYILDVSHGELAEDLRSVGDLKDSRAFQLIVGETVGTPGAEPWALLAGNYAFEPNKDDAATLVRFGKLAAAANAPFVSHMRPDVIGIRSFDGHTDPREWDLSGTSEAGRLWNVLRAMPEAPFLGMIVPRFLSRLPYGRETDPLEAFQFEEFDGRAPHDKYLWSNGCFIAALLIAQSFTEYEWQMDKRFLQDVERLPLHMYEHDGETVYQPCAEVLFTQVGAEQLMDFGLMPLISFKNTDHVKLGRFQSIADTGLRGRWSH